MAYLTNTTGYSAYGPSTAMSAGTRVSLSATGTVQPATTGIRGIGNITADTAGPQNLTGSPIIALADVNVRLNTAPGTAIGLLTGGTTTVGDTLYAAANGYISPTGTVIVGVNANVATIGQTANGSLVEYIVQGEV